MAAEIILGASLFRQESRVNHFREDFDFRDDENWLCWVDAVERNGQPAFDKTPIPTPFYPLRAETTDGAGVARTRPAGTVVAS